MKRYLRYDQETRRLEMVCEDFWEGQHEFTVFTVVGQEGRPLLGRSEFDGLAVRRDAFGSHYASNGRGGETYFEVAPTGTTTKVDCPKVVSKRRKCAHCAGPS